jgi:hypothetical protein
VKRSYTEDYKLLSQVGREEWRGQRKCEGRVVPDLLEERRGFKEGHHPWCALYEFGEPRFVNELTGVAVGTCAEVKEVAELVLQLDAVLGARVMAVSTRIAPRAAQMSETVANVGFEPTGPKESDVVD